VKSITQLLLEAPIERQALQDIMGKTNRMTIYYRGDDKGVSKGWRRVEMVSINRDNGKDYLIAKEIKKGAAKPNTNTTKFDLEGIVNWNVLARATETNDPYEEAVINKRVVSFEYMGDKENAPGVRTKVEPVCYGITKGKKYLRAWQRTGDTTSKVPAWKFFRVDRIKNFKPTGNETFTAAPSANFNPNGDKHIDKIIAIADFNPNDQEPASPFGPKPKSTGPKPKKTISSPKDTTPLKTVGSNEPDAPKKDVKGPARPGATKPERNKKGPARPGAIDESFTIREDSIVDSILDAIDIF
jgi:hypothetical protein